MTYYLTHRIQGYGIIDKTIAGNVLSDYVLYRLAIRLFVDMRQFNRGGLGGLQHFNNYFVGLITLAIEWVLKWVASALMLWGLWGWLFR